MTMVPSAGPATSQLKLELARAWQPIAVLTVLHFGALIAVPLALLFIGAEWLFVMPLVGGAAVEALRSDPSVTGVVLDHMNTLDLVSSVPAMGGDVARAEGYDGTGTAVAILDIGVQAFDGVVGLDQICGPRHSARGETS